MYKSVVMALACAASCPASASVFPFIDPMSASDLQLQGDVQKVKHVIQCADRPLEEFNESSSHFDRDGFLTSVSTIKQNLNFYLHPLASMGEFSQTFENGALKSYQSRIDQNGATVLIKGEAIKTDFRKRATVAKVTADTATLDDQKTRIQMVYGLTYQPGLIVIDNRVKMGGMPTISYKSVAEMTESTKLMRHTVQNPQTQELKTDFEAHFINDRPTETPTPTGGKVKFSYDGEDLTRIEAYTGLGMIAYVLDISDIEKDTCGNTVSALMTMSSPAKDQLDQRFNQSSSDDSLLRGSDPEPVRDDSLPDKCKVFEMKAEYRYYQQCKL